MARELGYRSKTRVIMLEDDLKYFKPDDIRDKVNPPILRDSTNGKLIGIRYDKRLFLISTP